MLQRHVINDTLFSSVFFQESTEDTSESTKAEPLLTNESHNPVLEESLEKALDAEDGVINNQANFLTPGKILLFLLVSQFLYPCLVICVVNNIQRT